MEITDELIACYAEGITSGEERDFVRNYLSEHPEEFERLLCLMDNDDVDYLGEQIEMADNCISMNESSFSGMAYSAAAFAPEQHCFFAKSKPQLNSERDVCDRLNDMLKELDNIEINLAPSTTVAVAVSAQKLFGMYKSGQFDYFTNKNVASSIDVLNDDVSDSKTYSEVTSIESTSGVDESGGIGFAQAETTHGQTSLDIEFDPEIYQYYPDTCAFQSQAIILREYGFNVTQEDLMQVAKAQGWYVDGYGTPADKVGKLLEYYGVDTSITEGNNIFNLANELAQNHHVLVTVDSGELWTPGMGEKLEDLLVGEKADHALLVVGIDTSNPSDVKVIVTDPGNGNAQYAYSEKQFMEAWKDSNCFMVSTNESPEEFIAHTEYSPMPTFADIPYDYIARLSESGISVADTECYHEFFDEFMSNPEELDSLMNEYSDLFEGEEDDVDFADDSE